MRKSAKIALMVIALGLLAAGVFLKTVREQNADRLDFDDYNRIVIQKPLYWIRGQQAKTMTETMDVPEPVHFPDYLQPDNFTDRLQAAIKQNFAGTSIKEVSSAGDAIFPFLQNTRASSKTVYVIPMVVYVYNKGTRVELYFCVNGKAKPCYAPGKKGGPREPPFLYIWSTYPRDANDLNQFLRAFRPQGNRSIFLRRPDSDGLGNAL